MVCVPAPQNVSVPSESPPSYSTSARAGCAQNTFGVQVPVCLSQESTGVRAGVGAKGTHHTSWQSTDDVGGKKESPRRCKLMESRVTAHRPENWKEAEGRRLESNKPSDMHLQNIQLSAAAAPSAGPHSPPSSTYY